MVDMMHRRGLLHLHSIPVPNTSPGQSTIERTLQHCIRNAADRAGGRDIPMENLYYSCLSYCTPKQDLWYVRWSKVDHVGKPLMDIHDGPLETLWSHVVRRLPRNFRVYEFGTPVWEDRYTPTRVERCGRDFLYVPNSPYVRTLVLRPK